jgi:hypothetical protein
VHPGALIADVDKLKQIAVEAGFCARRLKERLVGARCAGGHQHPIELVDGNGLADLGQPGVGAGEQAVVGIDDVG